MLFHVISCYFILFDVVSCYFVISCHFMLFRVISCYFVKFHVISYYFMLFRVISSALFFCEKVQIQKIVILPEISVNLDLERCRFNELDILAAVHTHLRRLIRIWRSWGLVGSKNRKQGAE